MSSQRLFQNITQKRAERFLYLGLICLGWVGLFQFALGPLVWANPSLPSDKDLKLKALWNAAGIKQELKTWTRSELSRMHQVVGKEKDLATGKTERWEGVLLSGLVDKMMTELPIEKSSQIDLVILRNGGGKSAFLPRAFISKYPVLLALNGTSPGSKFFHSVVPWTSKPKILTEDLPLETYFLSDVVAVELSNYREQFSPFFLRRRTDPSAMRGEKLFIQNCVGCHSQPDSQVLETQLDRFSGQGHPVGSFGNKLTERDRKSVIRYLQARKIEGTASVSFQGVAATK